MMSTFSKTGRIESFVDRIESFFARTASRINAVPTVKLILCLIGIFLVWRFVTLDFVEKSGDAVWKWSFLRYYTETGSWYPTLPDHHQIRWAINLPVLLFMKLFGTGPWVYYIYPLLTGLAAGLLLFFLVAEVGDKAAGTAAFLLLLIDPLAARESTQFLPMLSAGCYVLAAALVLVHRIRKNRGEFAFFAAGLLVGLAYGCKITSLYWGAAFMLGLAWFPFEEKTLFRIWKLRIGPGILLLGLGILTVLTVETLLLNHYFHVYGGRFEIILHSHLAQNWQSEDYLSLLQYLFSFLMPLSLHGKYFDTIPGVIVLACGFLPAILWLRKGSDNSGRKFIALSFLTTYFLQCYMIYKAFPFVHPEQPGGRYFLIPEILAIAMLAAGWTGIREFLARLLHGERKAGLVQWFVLIGFLVFALIRVGNQWSHGEIPLRMMRNAANFRTAQAEKLPVLMRLQNPRTVTSNRLSATDVRYGNVWIALWSPVDLIPARRTERGIVRDDRGRYWDLLWSGEKIFRGTPVRALLLNEGDSRLGTFTFGPDPARLPVQASVPE